MLTNLLKSSHTRGFVFEDIVERYLRKEKDNYYIFKTNKFVNFEKLIEFYELNCEKLDVELLKNYFKTIDIIEFVVDNFSTKNVLKINLYEIKTRIFGRKFPFDVTVTADNRFKELIKNGFSVSLVICMLYKNWSYSITSHRYQDFRYKRLRNRRFNYFLARSGSNPNIENVKVDCISSSCCE